MRSAAADDAAVIESSRREPERFAVLFDRHAPYIHRYLARRAGREVADDLVAETFLAAFAKRDRYDLSYQLIHWRPLIVTLAITVGLVEIALWLWTARAAGQGRNWARTLSAVLAGLATLQLGGIHGLADLFFAILTWLTGLAAVWLLWRPSARAFFRPQALSGSHGSPGNDTDGRP